MPLGLGQVPFSSLVYVAVFSDGGDGHKRSPPSRETGYESSEPWCGTANNVMGDGRVRCLFEDESGCGRLKDCAPGGRHWGAARSPRIGRCVWST